MPPEIAVETVAPAEAYERWREHRDRFAETGLWPILLEADEVAWMREAAAEQAPSTERDLAESWGIDAPTAFATMLENRREEIEQDAEEDDEIEMPDLDFDPADLPASRSASFAERIAAVFGPNEFRSGTRLALVPCGACWELPAILGHTGGDLYPPSAAEHVAILRYWNGQHGAEPLVMGGDTVQLLVRPITDPAEAKRVAIEQYAHCEDIVGQGTETVEALAAEILGSPVWFFWWD